MEIMEPKESMEIWCVPCFPETEDCEPTAKELDDLYKLLEANQMPDLQWRLPGRRLPSPDLKDVTENIVEMEEELTSNKEFDFSAMDEETTPQLRVRNNQQTSKYSVKKKTADFASVMDVMIKKHGRINTTSVTTSSTASVTTASNTSSNNGTVNTTTTASNSNPQSSATTSSNKENDGNSTTSTAVSPTSSASSTNTSSSGTSTTSAAAATTTSNTTAATTTTTSSTINSNTSTATTNN